MPRWPSWVGRHSALARPPTAIWGSRIKTDGWTRQRSRSLLRRLIDAWCDRRELKHLALLLPAYTSNFGLTDGWAGVMETLYDLRATRQLPQDEQAEVERLVPIVEQMVYRRS